MKKPFGIDTLATFDGGRLADVFGERLREVLADLSDRPRLAKARKITLSFTFEPASDEDGGALHDDVEVSYDVRASIPPVKFGGCVMEPKADGTGLLFNALSPDNPHQGTLDEQQERVDKRTGEIVQHPAHRAASGG